MAKLSFRGAGYCTTGSVAGGELPIWDLGPGGGWGEVRRPSGIGEPRRTERGGGDERNEVFGGGAEVADAANTLREAMR